MPYIHTYIANIPIHYHPPPLHAKEPLINGFWKRLRPHPHCCWKELPGPMGWGMTHSMNHMACDMTHIHLMSNINDNTNMNVCMP